MSDLFPDSNGQNYSMSFQVEGINPKEKSLIKATLLYNSASGWKELVSSQVSIKVLEGKVILNVNNDKEYELDDNDHKIKDQHDGFQGWYPTDLYSDTSALQDLTTTHGFENLFPILLKDLPQLSENMKYELRVNPFLGILTPNPNSGVNRLDYLKKITYASALRTALPMATHLYSIETHNSTKDLEFLFGIYPIGGTTSRNSVSLLLYPDTLNTPDTSIVMDNCFYTFRPIGKYFWMGSTRGTANISYDYPTEDGRVIADFQTYPNVTQVPDFADNYDANKEFLVFLHGFNVNTEDAYRWNKVMFRRLYWSGYRGNYLGITWDGDHGGDVAPLFFDTNVFHALQTSRSVRTFLAGLPPSKVNVMAHSLGNLVMWDALRLHKVHGGEVLAKNVISIQGAVWEDAFFPQGEIEYTTLTDPGHTVTYTENQLKLHSWAFWFRQDAHNAVTAAEYFINSYTPMDSALSVMKFWASSSTFDPYSRFNSIYYRTPNSNSLPEFVPLMQVSKRRPLAIYETLDTFAQRLDNPIGICEENPNCTSPILATSHGWINNEHSTMKTSPFYLIWSWFKEVLENQSNIIK